MLQRVVRAVPLFLLMVGSNWMAWSDSTELGLIETIGWLFTVPMLAIYFYDQRKRNTKLKE